MTVDANGDIDQAGKNLASFLTYLHDEHGVRKVNIVAHSMGGLFSRAALRVLQDAKSPIQYRSLTTIGTPWEGAFPADYANGSVSMSACKGDTLCQSIFKGFKQTLISQNANAGREVSYRYLAAQGGWNDRQAGVLKGIPVVLIAGDYLKMQGGSSATWPNDGLATPRSAHATSVSDEVLPHRKCILYNNLHSIYFSHIVGIPHEQALTWNPAVLTDVFEAIQNADSALARPNRIGCPPRHS
jgi:pimeloyl-ACP methyl ester carboxylesterase